MPSVSEKKGLPYMELHGSYWRWRRTCPDDLKKALGIETWCHKFDKDTPPEVLEVIATGLAADTDKRIEETRAKLAAIKAAREVREAKTVRRA